MEADVAGLEKKMKVEEVGGTAAMAGPVFHVYRERLSVV